MAFDCFRCTVIYGANEGDEGHSKLLQLLLLILTYRGIKNADQMVNVTGRRKQWEQRVLSKVTGSLICKIQVQERVDQISNRWLKRRRGNFHVAKDLKYWKKGLCECRCMVRIELSQIKQELQCFRQCRYIEYRDRALRGSLGENLCMANQVLWADELSLRSFCSLALTVLIFSAKWL